MLTLEELRKLRSAYDPHSSVAEIDVLQKIGNPTREEIIVSALDGLNSKDRNIRVLMLRVLKGQSGDQAMQGILIGLHDEKRRVREVAIKSSLPYLHDSKIIRRLQEMVTDEDETNKIRRTAFQTLTGHSVGESARELPKAAAESLQTLSKNDHYRERVLFNLLMLNLSPYVESLLKQFVESGSKREAILATKALCGYQVVNIGQFEDEAVVNHITETCERAAGRVLYWVRRDDLEQIRNRTFLKA